MAQKNENPRTYRIALVIYTMGDKEKKQAGGAERVMAIIANEFTRRGHDVHLLTLVSKAVRPFYALDPRITLHPLGLASESPNPIAGIQANIRRVKGLRKALEQVAPDIVIAFTNAVGVLSILATKRADTLTNRLLPGAHTLIDMIRGTHPRRPRPIGPSRRAATSPPVVVCEHIHPSQMISRAWAIVRRGVYPLADALVVLNEDCLDYMRSHFDENVINRTLIIPNPALDPPRRHGNAPPLDTPESAREPKADPNGTPGTPPRCKTIVGLGRLVPQKGFDRLIQAFARIASKHPDWRLVIWGEGPERPRLEALRAECGLENRVELPGTTDDAFGTLRRSDLFVLSSRYEGFPMALVEALACGLPVISYACETGPEALIGRDTNDEGYCGVLIPHEGDDAQNIRALARAMDKLLDDEETRKRLSARAPQIIERFSLDKVMLLWEGLMHNLIVRREAPLRDLVFVDTPEPWPEALREALTRQRDTGRPGGDRV